MTSIEKQVDIFNIFHDGSLIALIREGLDIWFEVEIPYLTKLLNPQFTVFKGKLVGCIEFRLKVWGEEATTLTELSEIVALRLGILDAKSNSDGFIVVTCWNGQEGGDLTVRVNDILIYDQCNQPIDFTQLAKICHQYWNRE